MKHLKALLQSRIHYAKTDDSKLNARRNVKRTASGLLAALAASVAGYGSAMAQPAATGVVNAIGVENEYADVISQIGGKYVKVMAIETDPNTDPHSFEVSPKVATEIASADLIVKNGIGYDDWADKIISAAPNA